MELEECIKDNFDESLRVYIQSQEYTRLKQQEDRLLSYLQAGLSDMHEYSRAMKSHFRKFGNQMSGSGNHLCNYASLLA